MGIGDNRIWVPKAKVTPRRELARDKRTIKTILTKRRKFVIVAVALSLGLFVIQLISVESRYLAMIGFLGLSYLMAAWALFRDLRGVAWFSNMILPTLYPVSVALFYFLLPQAFVVRIGVIIIFAISMYALLLTANIFSVASIRTIQLLRAARAVGFLFTVLTAAFIYHVVFSLRLPAYAITLTVFGLSYLLFYQGVWAHTLSEKGGTRELIYSLMGASVVAEASLALSFWLIDVALASIMLAMMMYVILGLFQQDLDKRLFQRTVQEYMGFALIVLAVIVTTVLVRWSI